MECERCKKAMANHGYVDEESAFVCSVCYLELSKPPKSLSLKSPVIKSLVAGLYNAPSELDRYAIMSDALEEDGQLKWAVTFKWCYSHNKYPYLNSQPIKYRWLWNLSVGNMGLRTTWLPVVLHGNRTGGKRSFTSFLKAMSYLHDKLHRFRDFVTVPGDIGYVKE